MIIKDGKVLDQYDYTFKNVIENDKSYIVVKYKDGDICWYADNKIYPFSREYGPAIVNEDGTKIYCLNGMPYYDTNSNKEWLKFQEELMIKEIIE